MRKIASLYLLTNICLGVCSLPHSVTAQISSDGTLSTTVSTDDAVNFLIENGDISGSNLFHSFSEFSIPNLGEAYFNNATDITNIFSRVTGGNISDIQGLIRANGTANLFLINPAGIVFGENASLDVGGSFFATTAESVVFGDDIEFSATQPQEAPLLTINITPGVQFGNNPGIIQVQGNGHNLELDDTFSPISDNRPVGLQVNSGQTLGLIGGDILIEGGNLTANQGRIELGSVAQSGTVNLTSTTDGFTADYTGIDNFGNLSFTQESSVDVSGEGSGNLHFQAGNISVLENSAIISNILGAEDGGEVLVRASQSVEIIGTDAGEFPSAFFNQGELDTTGNAGDLSMETDTFLVGNNAFISNSISGAGNGGDTTIDARNVQVTNGGVISGATLGDGNGGNITLRVEDTLTVDGDGNFSISGIFNQVGGIDGNGNAISGNGNGGDTTIDARNVQITNGGVISGSTAGDGNGGNITLRVEDTLTVDGDGNFSISGIGSQVGTIDGNGNVISGNGNGGEIDISARNVQITNGAVISGATAGDGNGGNITLRVEDTLTVDGDGNFSISGIFNQVGGIDGNGNAISGNGNGGDTTIDARNVQITNGAAISVSAFSAGDPGNLIVNAETITLDTQGSLQAEVTAGNQGNINLNSQFLLLRNNSNITTNAGEQATGGNIDIATVNLVALEDSDITANAVFGQGGNIIITAQGLFLSPDSDITASSERGIDGVVTLNTPEADNSAALIQLPTTLTDPSQQIAQGCAWTATSSFYVTGRGGIPQDPSAIIPANDILSDVRTSPNPQSSVISHQSPSGFTVAHGGNPQDRAVSPVRQIVEANTWIINEKGNVELVAIVTPQDPRYESLQASCVK